MTINSDLFAAVPCDGVHIVNIVDFGVSKNVSLGIRFQRLDALFNYMCSIDSVICAINNNDQVWVVMYCVDGVSFSIGNLLHLPGELGIGAAELTEALGNKANVSGGLIVATTDEQISINWHIDDVLEVRPDLTKQQAIDVLQYAKSKHDACMGINWEVL